MQKMLVLSRLLVVALLIVDWVEDPHFGTYLFSAPMSSSEVSLLDLGFRHGKCLEEAEKAFSPDQPAPEFSLLPTVVSRIPAEGSPARIDHSLESTYVFMSIQI
jgi:hypothetical protein